MAEGLNARGISVAIPSYDLCPDVTIRHIIGEMRIFLAALWAKTAKLPVVTGHSAGGHLAASMLATDWSAEEGVPDDLVRAAYAMSGLYDLRPLLQTSINEDIRLAPEEAEQISPLFAEPPVGTTLVAAVGAQESGEFHRQSRELATAWAVGGVTADYVEIEDTNHFTIVDALTAEGSEMTEQIAGMAEAVTRS